eukprot:1161566-Pelagomonas_calceolata.AAC.6
MVGDRLDTDIMFGKNGGLSTCLVLSGEGAWCCKKKKVYLNIGQSCGNDLMVRGWDGHGLLTFPLQAHQGPEEDVKGMGKI